MTSKQVIKQLTTPELALINAWCENGHGTNWFFWIDDPEADEDDQISKVVEQARPGLVKMIPLGAGNIIEVSPQLLKMIGSADVGELDDLSVLEDLLKKLQEEDSLGTFVVGWSQNHTKFMRGDDEIPRYCGSLELHKKLLAQYGYYYDRDASVVLESGDGVLAPLLRLEPPEDWESRELIDIDDLENQLKSAISSSTEDMISL